MQKNSKIYIAGHRGMVGSAIVRLLNQAGYTNLLLRTHRELDLTNQQAVADFFQKEKPEYVFVAAARVGGIKANSQFCAEFIYENLMLETNIIHQAYKNQVRKLLFLGSTCIYPRYNGFTKNLIPQPMKENYLLAGHLEPTNEAYAIAKIAGIKLCQMYRRQYGADFISAMPTNLYGLNDNYHLEDSHVLPALIRRFHEAKINNSPEIVCWGSGKPVREFLYVDDLAEACLFLMENYSEEEHVNVGTGEGISIKKLTELIVQVVGAKGRIIWDKTKPDGHPKKVSDIAKIKALGWSPRTKLAEGIKKAYEDFLKNKELRK